MIAVTPNDRQDIALEQDVRMAFLKRAIEIEELLRRTARSRGISVPPNASAGQIVRQLSVGGVLDPELVSRFLAIWDIRNKVVHGYDVPTSIANHRCKT